MIAACSHPSSGTIPALLLVSAVVLASAPGTQGRKLDPALVAGGDVQTSVGAPDVLSY